MGLRPVRKSFQAFVMVMDGETLGLNLTQALTTDSWGSLTLEYGVQWASSITAGENRQSPTGLNLLPFSLTGTPFSVPLADDSVLYNLSSIFVGGEMAAYRWDALGIEGGQEIKNLGIYAQDTWETGKWRFDLGLRWDDYDGTGLLETQDFAFDEIAPRFEDRKGGYTRVLRLAKPRLGDAGAQAILELVGHHERVRRTAPKPTFEEETEESDEQDVAPEDDEDA